MKQKRLKIYALANELNLDRSNTGTIALQKGHRIDLMTTFKRL